ncbi:hypothetical protein RCO48_26375 [Peribacillus frigoritolerans]|nr:hypothetical protein [Peribacillus frigoritolerans]
MIVEEGARLRRGSQAAAKNRVPGSEIYARNCNRHKITGKLVFFEFVYSLNDSFIT